MTFWSEIAKEISLKSLYTDRPDIVITYNVLVTFFSYISLTDTQPSNKTVEKVRMLQWLYSLIRNNKR